MPEMSESDFSSLRCLVVDDHPFQRTVMRKVLLRLGIGNVDEAGDGQEALNLLDAGCPDVVLCDLQMPSMDGVELLRHLGQFFKIRRRTVDDCQHTAHGVAAE